MDAHRKAKRPLHTALAAAATLVALVPAAPAQAATRVSITAPVSIQVGRMAHIHGVVSGPSAGAPIELLKYGSGSWSVIQRNRVASNRAYSFRTSATRGSNAYMARVHAHRALKSGGVSKSVLVLGVDPPAPAPTSVPCAGDGATDGWTVAEVRCRILSDTNAFRARHGKAALVEVPGTDTVAQDWAGHMAETEEFVHNPDYGSQLPSGWEEIGENIAAGQSPDTVVATWIASGGHRENLLGDYNGIGIGYAKSSRTYYVQNFTRY